MTIEQNGQSPSHASKISLDQPLSSESHNYNLNRAKYESFLQFLRQQPEFKNRESNTRQLFILLQGYTSQFPKMESRSTRTDIMSKHPFDLDFWLKYVTNPYTGAFPHNYAQEVFTLAKKFMQLPNQTKIRPKFTDRLETMLDQVQQKISSNWEFVIRTATTFALAGLAATTVQPKMIVTSAQDVVFNHKQFEAPAEVNFTVNKLTPQNPTSNVENHSNSALLSNEQSLNSSMRIDTTSLFTSSVHHQIQNSVTQLEQNYSHKIYGSALLQHVQNRTNQALAKVYFAQKNHDSRFAQDAVKDLQTSNDSVRVLLNSYDLQPYEISRILDETARINSLILANLPMSLDNLLGTNKFQNGIPFGGEFVPHT